MKLNRTTEETKALIERLLQDAAPEGMTEEEMASIVEWLDGARIDAHLLDLFDRGEVKVRWGDGEPKFCLRR